MKTPVTEAVHWETSVKLVWNMNPSCMQQLIRKDFIRIEDLTLCCFLYTLRGPTDIFEAICII